MLEFALSRLVAALFVAFGVVSAVFLLLHVVPGDPVEVMLGEWASATDREALRAALGLDVPLPLQWWHYLTRVAHLDLGTTIFTKRPVAALLAERLPATACLAAAGVGIALAIGLPLGILAALRQGGRVDHGAMLFALLGVSIPNFWLGSLLILFFSLWLGWLPVSGREGLSSLVLPAVTLGLPLAAILSRMVRAALLEVLAEDYVRTARAKGMPERVVVLRHALKNAGLPILTVVGLQLGTLLGGAVITETVFSWPGIGGLLVEAIERRDYPLVQGTVLVISLTYVLINTLTDLAYGLIDPRLREGQGRT
jgi:peptide/nickel transport system permease protein